jgi:DnaK suppressor protein
MAARKTPRQPGAMTDSKRQQMLRQSLEARRRELSDEVHGRLRDVRAEVAARTTGAQDPGDLADADLQDELRLSLIQMKAETLNKVDEALARLDAGNYGHCHECHGPIAPGRLVALPFAVRCTSCEVRHEAEGSMGSALRDAQTFAVGW